MRRHRINLNLTHDHNSKVSIIVDNTQTERKNALDSSVIKPWFIYLFIIFTLRSRTYTRVARYYFNFRPQHVQPGPRICLFVGWLVGLFVCSFTLLVCSFARLLVGSFARLFVCSFVRFTLLVCSFVAFFVCPFVSLFPPLFTLSFVASFLCSTPALVQWPGHHRLQKSGYIIDFR